MGEKRSLVIYNRLKKGMWPIWTKEERCNHILRCEETRGCRDELVDKRLTGIDLETGIIKIAANKNTDN